MANERKIRISAEFDASQVMSSINQIRQQLSNLGVDNTLFKDINKDLDRISKDVISVNAAIKNGIPEKDINSFLKTTSEVSKIFGTLPDKIRQVSGQISNVHLPKDITSRLTEIETEIERLGVEARTVLGDGLRKELRGAVSADIIDTKALDNIVKAKDKAEELGNAIANVREKARKASNDLNSFVVGLANPKDIDPALTGKNREKALRQNANSIQLSRMLSDSLSNGTIAQDRDALQGMFSSLGKRQTELNNFINTIDRYITAQRQAGEAEANRQKLLDIINNAEATSAQKVQEITRLTQEGATISRNAIQGITTGLSTVANNATVAGQRTNTAMTNVADSASRANTHIQRQDSLIRQIAMRASSIIGVGAAFNYITRGVREAWQGIRDLDKEFTQIAVVTDKTTSQLWQSFNTYSQMAQGLGVTTKDAVATSALYYQQGLDTAEVMTLTAETIKMAQIAGMDFATATNQMTAALRGFNLEMEQASTVNDIFSTLAANAAVSTEELAYALTKTASIADSAGMSIDTTSAFLTKMIETTREAPENIGTAMKSIIARFEELKSNPLALTVEVDGEEIVANKVESAIALAGVKLRDAAGQFRDLDDVFLELAKSWDGLDRNTQRYIATIAAGSRQQSRFIAMMDGYDRTLELVELAQDSEGQSAAQFLKTLDSLDSKLSKISNSFEQLYQKFVNSDFFGGLLDNLNNLLQSLGNFDAGTLATFAVMGLTIGNNIIRGFTQAIRGAGSVVSEKFYGFIGNIGQRAANVIGKRSIEARTNKIQENYNTKQRDIYNKYNTPINEKYHINIEGIDKARKDLNDLENDLKDVEVEIQRINSLSLEEQQNPEQQQKLEDAKNKQAELRDKIFGQRETLQAVEEAQSNMQQELDDAYAEMQQELNTQTNEVRTNIVNAMSSIGPAAISSLAVGITSALSSENPFDAIWQTATAFLAQTAPMILGQFIQFVTTGGEAVTGAAIASTAGVAAIFLAITAAVTAAVALIKTAIDNNKSDAEKLKEQISQLENKSKELSEVSERSTAEAALKKTETKKMNNLIDTYDELIDKTGRTAEENQKLIEVQNELAEDYPDLLSYYDEAGNAKLKERNTWQDIVELQKESTRLAQNQAFADKMQLSSTEVQLTQARMQLLEAQHQDKLNKKNINENTTNVDNGNITYNTNDSNGAKKILSSILSGPDKLIDDYLKHAQSANTSKHGYSEPARDINGYFSKMLSDVANEKDSKERVNIVKQYMTELDDSYSNVINEQSALLFEGTEEALTEYYEDFQYFINSDNNSEYKKSQEEVQKAYRKLQSDLEKSIKGYIETLSPETINGYSEETKNVIAKQLAEKNKDEIAKASNVKTAIGNTVEDLDNYEKQIQEAINSGKITNTAGADALNALKKLRENSDKQYSFGERFTYTRDKSVAEEFEESLTPEEKDALMTANNALIQMLGDQTAARAEEILTKIKETLGEDSDEFRWLQINPEQLSEEARNAILNGLEGSSEERKLIKAEFDEIYGDNGKIKELDERFQEIAQHFSYNLGEAIQNMGASDEAVNSLENIINQGTIDQAQKLVSLLSSKDLDWGNPNDIKQVAAAVYDITRNTEDTINAVERLQSTFATISNINISPDRFDTKFQEWGKSINDIKKEYKDLSSAIDEFNEYGKLTASTIIDLVEAGNIQYLTYNKTTKAVEINTAAVQESFKTKIAEQKLAIQNTITQAKQLRDGYLLQAKLYRKRAELIKDSLDDNHKITKEGLKELLNLEQVNAILIEDNQLKLNTAQIINNKSYFSDMYDDDKKYFANLSELAFAGGQDFAASFMAGLSGDNTAITQKINETANKIFTLTDAHSKQFARNYQELSDEEIEAMLPEFDAQKAIEYYETMADGMEDLADSTTEVINTQEDYYNIISSLDGADISDYYKSAADGAEEANKELKKYISSLERFYNLNKEIEEADRKYNKAKKEFDKNPTQENGQAVLDAVIEKGRLGAKQKRSGEEQEKLDREYARTEMSQFFSEKGINLTPEQLQNFYNRTNLQEGATGQLNQRGYKEWLIEQKKAGNVTYDNAEDLEKLWEEWLGTIDDDIKMQIEGQESIEESQVDIEDFEESIKKLEELIDPLTAIKAGIEAANKILEQTKESLDDYYESGGREGTNIAQYAHTVGSAIDLNDTTLGKLDIYKNNLISQNSDLMKYVVDLGNGNWTYDYTTVNGLTDQKTIDEVDKLLKKLQDLGATEEELKKSSKELGKALQNMLKENRSQYSNMVNRVAQALADLDQRQIDEVKKKYAMIQEEDDKYLESLQKSIDKQRQLRDQAKSYDDLEEQEKRLALLERDTSGANAAEIAALREQIKDARQSLVDTEQDNIVNNISDNNEERKKKMDEETTFLQNVMDERTYDMQYYIEKAYEIVDSAIAGDEGAYQRMIDILQKTDEEFYRNTREGQQEWFEALETSWTHAKDHALAVQTGLIENLGATSQEVHNNLVQFAKDDTEYVSEASKSLEILKSQTDVIDLTKCWEDLKRSASEAKDKIVEIIDLINKGPFETEVRIKWTEIGKPDGSGNGDSGLSGGLPDTTDDTDKKYVVYENSTGKIVGVRSDKGSDAWNKLFTTGSLSYRLAEGAEAELEETNWGDLKRQKTVEPKTPLESEDFQKPPTRSGTDLLGVDTLSEEQINEVKNKYYVIYMDKPETNKLEGEYNSANEAWDVLRDNDKKLMKEGFNVLTGREVLLNLGNSDEEQQDWWIRKLFHYARGGLVDFTGPAWVDGTKTAPEAFLSASDTRNIQALTEILQGVLMPTSTTTSAVGQVPTKAGDTSMEFHIEIGEIADDYDVDQMLDQIQSRIAEASEGQVTIVR